MFERAHRRFADERCPVGAEGGEIVGLCDVSVSVRGGGHVRDRALKSASTKGDTKFATAGRCVKGSAA